MRLLLVSFLLAHFVRIGGVRFLLVSLALARLCLASGECLLLVNLLRGLAHFVICRDVNLERRLRRESF